MVAQLRSMYASGGSARSPIKGKRRSAIREIIYGQEKASKKKENPIDSWFKNFIQDAVSIDKSMRGTTDTIMDDILQPHLSGEVENP